MAEKSVPVAEREINPVFVIPEGLAGYRYAEQSVDGSVNQTVDVSIEIAPDVLLGTDNANPLEDTSGAPGIPQSFTVLQQIVRVIPTGQQVVDLVVEVDDIMGAQRYEFRITKA